MDVLECCATEEVSLSLGVANDQIMLATRRETVGFDSVRTVKELYFHYL